MDTIPSLKDELERKTMQEIERIALDTRKGRISKREVRSSIRTLFNTVSGLVESEIIDKYLSMLSDELDKLSAIELLVKDGRYTLIDARDMETAIIYKFCPDVNSSISIEVIPELVNKLLNRGYEQC